MCECDDTRRWGSTIYPWSNANRNRSHLWESSLFRRCWNPGDLVDCVKFILAKIWSKVHRRTERNLCRIERKWIRTITVWPVIKVVHRTPSTIWTTIDRFNPSFWFFTELVFDFLCMLNKNSFSFSLSIFQKEVKKKGWWSETKSNLSLHFLPLRNKQMMMITKDSVVLICCYFLLTTQILSVEMEDNYYPSEPQFHHHHHHRHRHRHFLRKPNESDDQVKVMIYRRLEHRRPKEPCSAGTCTKAPECSSRKTNSSNNTKSRRRCTCNESNCRHDPKAKHPK